MPTAFGKADKDSLPLRTPSPGAVSTYTAYDAQGNAHTRQYAHSETTSEVFNATAVGASACAMQATLKTRCRRFQGIALVDLSLLLFFMIDILEK